MGDITAAELAYHLGARIDGEWDDGLEAYVEASSDNNVLTVDLKGDGGDHIGTFRVTVEKV